MDRPAVPSARRHRSLAAVLFDPLHKRVQATVDGRFYRARDAERTVSSFPARLRDDVDIDRLRLHILEVVGGGVEPTGLAMWLRPGPAR